MQTHGTISVVQNGEYGENARMQFSICTRLCFLSLSTTIPIFIVLPEAYLAPCQTSKMEKFLQKYLAT